MSPLLAAAGVFIAAVLAAFLTRQLSRAAKWWWAGAAAALVQLWALVSTTGWEALPFTVAAIAWGTGIAVDLAEHRLPDLITLAPVPLFFALFLPSMSASGEWRRLGEAVLGSLLTAAVLFALAYINPDGFGLGDVKLGLTTGAALGWFGLGTALLGLGAAFILMAVISGLLLATRRIKRDAEIAFGPFMVLGVLVAPAAANLLGW
ncbi:prepilin peptidase [Tessaracoccus sp. Z1128]